MFFIEAFHAAHDCFSLVVFAIGGHFHKNVDTIDLQQKVIKLTKQQSL
jgi:hypothetical protein